MENSAGEWIALAGLLGTLLGVGVTLLGVFVMRRTHTLNVTKATPRIGCSVDVSFRQDDPNTYYPTLFLTATIYNEGELAASALHGHWKLLVGDGALYFDRPIDRDFLGTCEKYLDSYCIEESCDWHREDIRFDVEIEFDYLTLPNDEERHYSAAYSYDTQSQKLKRHQSSSPTSH
jgi:hypothetical protein